MFNIQGICVNDYRQVLKERFFEPLDTISSRSGRALQVARSLPKIALLHSVVSPLGPAFRNLFANLGARKGSRFFSYNLKDSNDMAPIDRFQAQLHALRWPPDYRGNIDLVTQPVDMGNGETPFPYLLEAYEWLLGQKFAGADTAAGQRNIAGKNDGSAMLIGLFSDPVLEVRWLQERVG